MGLRSKKVERKRDIERMRKEIEAGISSLPRGAEFLLFFVTLRPLLWLAPLALYSLAFALVGWWALAVVALPWLGWRLFLAFGLFVFARGVRRLESASDAFDSAAARSVE